MSERKGRNQIKFTENWLPIKNISDGMIILKNNQRVTGVKIVPRNIFILPQNEQDAIINSLKNVYNQIDYEFNLMIADRPVDISVYLSKLQVEYNKTQSPAIRRLILEDIDKGNGFINNSVVDTEYYILFKHKNMEVINKRIRNLITALASAGIEATQVTSDDLRVLYDNFLNGGKKMTYRTVAVS